MDVSAAPKELSRREKETADKEAAARRYEKLHAQGLTDQAQKDLARLELVKKQREQAKLKREQELAAAAAKQ